MRRIERLRCRHRIRVLQNHEDTAKENAVSRHRVTVTLSPSLTSALIKPPSLSSCVSVQLRLVTPDVSISAEVLADVYDLFKVATSSNSFPSSAE